MQALIHAVLQYIAGTMALQYNSLRQEDVYWLSMRSINVTLCCFCAKTPYCAFSMSPATLTATSTPQSKSTTATSSATPWGRSQPRPRPAWCPSIGSSSSSCTFALFEAISGIILAIFVLSLHPCTFCTVVARPVVQFKILELWKGAFLASRLGYS